MSLVNFVELVKTGGERVAGCQGMMKSCHIVVFDILCYLAILYFA